ncbi:MAG: 50S ribosomal protein L3 [Candidatus Magasanikbacteria bacterium]|jgi:large subunit ribosomal protein L3|nr:50S ribosomal protein L3 [Candidatus Magasanikbacteria bacterium]MBT5262661.1 50S ribosomal protein L3 [Candidatus Magasanikbacteria bacterium]MBT5820282.1 50S ribosomal protein L3 [Candidatus Magasanikbacteria bacterium]MBT6294545.1 50S ribosomal protein L3 [Candidatus Magasanikbacteria bacterium]
MKFILGKKLDMTQVFRDNGEVVPVTRVQAGPCTVTQVKKMPKDRVNAVQIGFGTQKMFRLNKAQQGHIKGMDPISTIRDMSVGAEEHGLKRGDKYTVSVFNSGEKVQVTGTSKGKGFQGVVKRHGFAGSPKTHGHKDQHRMPGSIGATGPARVFKGTRMGGHMGVDRVTVKNLEIMEINEEANEMLLKGAIPGARGGIIMISTYEGGMEVTSTVSEESKEKSVEDSPKEVVTQTKEEEPKVAEEKNEVITDSVVSEDAKTTEEK